ncbi:hypothetical protein IG631_17624 [Alternaria alternata]|nr:hypothetical protein IG631_17624 [Alternaria alternata]
MSYLITWVNFPQLRRFLPHAAVATVCLSHPSFQNDIVQRRSLSLCDIADEPPADDRRRLGEGRPLETNATCCRNVSRFVSCMRACGTATISDELPRVTTTSVKRRVQKTQASLLQHSLGMMWRNRPSSYLIFSHGAVHGKLRHGTSHNVPQRPTYPIRSRTLSHLDGATKVLGLSPTAVIYLRAVSSCTGIRGGNFCSSRASGDQNS